MWKWSDDTLNVYFEVKPIVDIVWPAKIKTAREYELWKTTCFEFFLSQKDSKSYIEFNLSPSGAWDAYEFSEYRSPSSPKRFMDVDLVLFEQTEQTVRAEFKFKKNFSPDLEANITAVIEDSHGIHYYACHHAKDKPDFHDRKSICINFN